MKEDKETEQIIRTVKELLIKHDIKLEENENM